jgi:hypothetical protein
VTHLLFAFAFTSAFVSPSARQSHDSATRSAGVTTSTVWSALFSQVARAKPY